MSDILVNYLVVQFGIILFIAPFFVWYRRSHGRDAGETPPFNHHLEKFFGSRQANYLVFFWAMGEAIVWFVIPEFLLLLMVFMRVKGKRQLVKYDIYGTGAGVLAAYLMNLSSSAIANLPYVQSKMIDEVLQWYDRLGVWGLVHQPFSGIPFKVFTHTAEPYGFPLLLFLVVAVVVRISRYVVAYGMFVAMYPFLHKYVRRNYVPLFFIASFIFSILLYRVYQSYA